MKKLLFVLLLFIGFKSFAQYPTGYTGINSRYDWLSGKFRGLHAPSGSAPALASGQWSGAGALFVDTSGAGQGLYHLRNGSFIRSLEPDDTTGRWVGNLWISGGNLYMRVNGTTSNLGAVGGSGTTDTSIVSTKARVMQVVDSLSAAGWPPRTLQQTLTTGSTLTGANSITGNDDLVLSGFIELDFNASQISITGTDGGASSQIGIAKDSIVLKPLTGKINIDSLRKSYVSTDRVMTWDESTGMVRSTVINNTLGNKSGVPADPIKYHGFPSVANTERNERVIMVSKSADDHATNGPGYIQWSTDGGGSWTDTARIYVDGSPLSNIATVSVAYAGGKTFIQYNITSNYTRCAYATSFTNMFTGLDSLGVIGTETGIQSFGDGFTIADQDTVYMTGYSWSGDSTWAFITKSSVANPGFTRHAYVMRNYSAGTFPQGPISETSVICMIKGTHDATSTLMAATRSDFYKDKHYQSYSTDGGLTWTKITSDWMFLAVNPGAATAYPVKMITDGTYTWAVVCVRESVAGQTQTRIFKMKNTNYSTPNSWISTNGRNYTIPYYGLYGYKSEIIDGGYGSAFFTPQGQKRVVQYDASPRKRFGIDGLSATDRIRLVSFPIDGVFYYEANAITNQAIPTGVRTALTFGNIVYDTDNFYNADSSVIEFPADGIYHIEALFRTDTTSSGTEIIGELFRVDRGAELGSNTNAYNSALATLDYKAIQPSTNSKFTYIKLSGKCYGYKGMKVRVTVTHDKGSDLNIINSYTGNQYIPDGNASITIKKLD